MPDRSITAADRDTATLQLRALRRRQHFARSSHRKALRQLFEQVSRSLRSHSRALPARLALHLLVALFIPLAMLANQISTQLPDASLPVRPAADAAPPDIVAPIAPIPLETGAEDDAPVSESNFSAIDALPITAMQTELLKPRPIAATIVAESANVRS